MYYINDSYNLAQKKISENILKNNGLNHQVEYEKTKSKKEKEETKIKL